MGPIRDHYHNPAIVKRKGSYQKYNNITICPSHNEVFLLILIYDIELDLVNNDEFSKTIQ